MLPDVCLVFDITLVVTEQWAFCFDAAPARNQYAYKVNLEEIRKDIFNILTANAKKIKVK